MVIKALEILENPFSDYGNIIYGERFIGRKREISLIRDRVLSLNYGNLAIVGLPRVGKSSLGWQSIMIEKEKLLKEKTLVINMNIGTINSTPNFYQDLINKVISILKKNAPGLVLDNNFEKMTNINIDFSEIQNFFTILRFNGFKVILILDEFDHVTNFFKLEDFQFLRELSISPDTRICLITISRKTLKEIEKENGGISNLYGVFRELNLGLFNATDLEDYWKHFSNLGIYFSDEYKDSVCCKVGNHPFLMDFYNFEFFNNLKKTSVGEKFFSINEIEQEIRLPLFEHFENMLNLLRQQDLESKVIQVVFGPVYDLSVLDTEKLIKYDFIKKILTKKKSEIFGDNFGIQNNEDEGYICFSTYFTQYLLLKLNEIPFWPLWGQTEKILRELIKLYVKEKYGENWLESILLINNNEYIKKFIDRLKIIKNNTVSKFGDLANKHLLDYTYPKDIYNNFIQHDWDWFQKVLGDTENDWKKRFFVLANIRNPIAHNNMDVVSKDQINVAKGICELIIQKWKNFNKNNTL